MSMHKQNNNKHVHKMFKRVLIFILAIVVFSAGVYFWNSYKIDKFQKSISGFYDTTGLQTQGPLGEIVRKEIIQTGIENGTAYRVLYRTQKANDDITFTSGMIFVPATIAASPRPVVAWAHGTLGGGDNCAPSRQEQPVSSSRLPWINSMLAKGWIVTATDYAGLGTPGISEYLVGKSEAHDVLNSVRAVSYIANNNSGKQYAIWGHSQGGHSALFSSLYASEYMPEYQLVGTSASAPAAQLESLLNAQYDTLASWVIGPQLVAGWKTAYPTLSTYNIINSKVQDQYVKLSRQCIAESSVSGIVRQKTGQRFFTSDFLNNSRWQDIIKMQTAPVLPKAIPIQISESLSDQVVLPATTAQYISRACAAGSNINTLWINNVSHQQIPSVISPNVINWINDRFTQQINPNTCNQPLPIPAS